MLRFLVPPWPSWPADPSPKVNAFPHSVTRTKRRQVNGQRETGREGEREIEREGEREREKGVES